MIEPPSAWVFPLMPMPVYTALFARAIAQGVTLHPDDADGGLFDIATSGTQPGVTYRVNEWYCTCPAGQVGSPCKHRALYLAKHMDRLGRGFYTTEEAQTWRSAYDELPAIAATEGSLE